MKEVLCDLWLFVHAFDKIAKKYSWQMFDIYNSVWHTVPEMPSMHHLCPGGLKCVSIPTEGVLFVCGVVSSQAHDIPLNLVMKYDITTNSWSVSIKMDTLTPFYESGGTIGWDGENRFDTNSYTVEDEVGNLYPIRNAGDKMGLYDVAVLKYYTLVTRPRVFPNYDVIPEGFVYDRRTRRWGCNTNFRLLEGWIGSSVVVFGRLFVLSEVEYKTTRLKVFDARSNSWENVNVTNPFPEEFVCRHFSVTCFDHTIFVVGLNLRVAMGTISKIRVGGENDCDFSVNWKAVNGSKNVNFLGYKPYNAHTLLTFFLADS